MATLPPVLCLAGHLPALGRGYQIYAWTERSSRMAGLGAEAEASAPAPAHRHLASLPPFLPPPPLLAVQPMRKGRG